MVSIFGIVGTLNFMVSEVHLWCRRYVLQVVSTEHFNFDHNDN